MIETTSPYSGDKVVVFETEQEFRDYLGEYDE